MVNFPHSPFSSLLVLSFPKYLSVSHTPSFHLSFLNSLYAKPTFPLSITCYCPSLSCLRPWYPYTSFPPCPGVLLCPCAPPSSGHNTHPPSGDTIRQEGAQGRVVLNFYDLRCISLSLQILLKVINLKSSVIAVVKLGRQAVTLVRCP